MICPSPSWAAIGVFPSALNVNPFSSVFKSKVAIFLSTGKNFRVARSNLTRLNCPMLIFCAAQGRNRTAISKITSSLFCMQLLSGHCRIARTGNRDVTTIGAHTLAVVSQCSNTTHLYL